MEVVSVELQLNNQSVASFNDLFVDTDLRLSSLHFAISSAVSSLILLAPGAWFCKQEEKKKCKQRKTLRISLHGTQRVVSPTFFQWMLTIFSWAMKLQSDTEHYKRDGKEAVSKTWTQISTNDMNIGMKSD